MDEGCVHLSFIPHEVFCKNGRSDGKGMNEQTQEDMEEIESLILDALECEGIDRRTSTSFYRLEAVYFGALKCDAALEMMRKRMRWVIDTDGWNKEEVAFLMNIVSDSLQQAVEHTRKAMARLYDGMIEDIKAHEYVTEHEDDVSNAQ